MVSVVKKDGSIHPYDCEKIKIMIDRACNGLDVNPLLLESRFDSILRDGITTTEIQMNLIEHAKSLASPVEPDWVFVAGRLLAMDRWSETKSYEIQFLDFYKQKIKSGDYSHPALLIYSDSEIEYLGSLIDKNRDLDLSFSSINKFISTDLVEGENVQQMFMVTAMILASVEKSDVRVSKAKDFFDCISDREGSLATPFLINLRRNGNTASCFTITMTDDLDSIMKAAREAAEISKAGGGVGIDFSALRAPRSYLMGVAGASAGATGFIKIFNDIAVAVNQAGKRKGAFTCSMPLWNGNIFEFLDINTESGDPRKKCHDIQPQVLVHDLFMVLKDDKEAIWYTFCPYEVKTKLGISLNEVFNEEFVDAYNRCVDAYKHGVLTVVQPIRACELWVTLLQRAFETGLPYVMFIDKMNRENPNKHDGIIRTANLCVAPETLILTDRGQLPIDSLEGKLVNVWNGQEWSEVEVVKTGSNQKLIRVVVQGTDFWSELECTEYHKFYLHDGTEIRAHELKFGDSLLSWKDENGFDNNQYVISVNDDGRYDDTYCFKEHKRGMGVFNGILTGQCIESFSNTTPHQYSHTCNLASLVVGRIPMDRLTSVARTLTRMLDNSIELSKSPIESSYAHNERYRTIGVGVQGLHDLIARERKTYNNTKFITEVFERIEYGTVLESIELAKERGAYPAFEGSMWQTGERFELFKKHSVCEDLDWSYLESECAKYGIRNSQTTSPAPNTSTSMRMDAAAGVMPSYGGFFYESNGDITTPVAAMYLKENPLSYARNIASYKPAQLVPAVAAMQLFVDTGISAEYVVNLNDETFTALDIAELYQKAWELGTKGVYYLRTVKKGESLVKESEICASCAG